MQSRTRMFALLSIALLFVAAWSHASFAQQFDASTYAGLRWRMIGPFRAGRVNGVTGVPGQPNTFYFGSVGGGLWKSTNAGRTWDPVVDDQNIASIGAVAVPASGPETAYVGTGEAHTRSQNSLV